MRVLTVHPIHGLANRLMSLIAGAHVASKMGYRLQVIWEKSIDFHAELGDLFDAEFDLLTLDEFWERNRAEPLAVVTSGNAEGYIPDGLDHPCLASFQHEGLLVFPTKIFQKWNVLVRSQHFFYVEGDEWNQSPSRRLLAQELGRCFSSFAPKPYIRDAVDALDNRIMTGIGLHIRRAYPAAWSDPHPRFDTERTQWQFPTLESYVELVPVVRKRFNLDGPVFLSTNCLETKAKVIDALGQDSVMYHSIRTDDHAGAEAIQDALVDMIALSKTAVIMRFSGSTFSFLSAAIGNRPQIVFYQSGHAILREPLEY